MLLRNRNDCGRRVSGQSTMANARKRYQPSLEALELRAVPAAQWAASVLDFSSEYSSSSWSAAQALGAPDTADYGDIPTAWAPLPINGTQEYLTLGFATRYHATGFTIVETYGNGFVTGVELLDKDGVYHQVWTGTDPSQPGTPVSFSQDFTQTTYEAKGIRISVDTDHDLNAWEEIDAVELRGEAVPSGPPVLEDPGDRTFVADEYVELQVVASDPDDDPLTYSAENLPPGLSIDPNSGLISGTVQSTNPEEGNDAYEVVIHVTDGINEVAASALFQVAAITITGVTITPPAGFSGTLPNTGLSTIFTLTVTATGPRGANASLWWSIREPDSGWSAPDDHLIKDRRFEIVIGANGTATFAPTFALFCKRNGVVRGVDEDSGEVNPDPLYARIASGAGTELRRSTGTTVAGAASTPQNSTSGWENVTGDITVVLNPPTGFTGTLAREVIPQVWTFTVTLHGTPNTTVANLRWSVIEPNSVLADTEMVYEREFSVSIAANGVGTATISFLLWADNSGYISGVDANSGERTTDPIYVLIERSSGANVATSNTHVVRGGA